MIRQSSLLLAVALLLTLPATAKECRVWPDWERFSAHFVDENGRVIDPSTERRYTTSEGQSYAMFFAFAANDEASFERVLRWTVDNLAGGDLTARLPAWQWGRRDDGSWGILDDNAAADSDLWIAYVLAEAGRLWRNQRYSALGELLAQRILREETVLLPGFGLTLLPGRRGFALTPDTWRLNPSYVPIQLVRRLAALYPASDWKRVVPTSVDLVVRASPLGFVPEWVLYRANTGFLPDQTSSGKGSYNAIRVYLWAGMLDAEDPAKSVIVKALQPMARSVERLGAPPLETDSRTGSVFGIGSAGFSAALVPFLLASRLPEAARTQLLRIKAAALLDRADNYYDRVLALFGLGWSEGRFRFGRDGALMPRWTCDDP